MVFYGSLFKLANRTGVLIALHKENRWYKLLTIASYFSIWNMLVHTATFYAENIEDFDLSTSVLGGLINIVTHSIKIPLILVKNDDLIRLYHKVSKLCTDPKLTNFEAAKDLERKIELFTKIYFCFLGLVIVVVSSNPLIVQSIEFFRTGRVDVYRWELPFPYANPLFSLKSSPAYEITYAIYASSVIPMVGCALSPDLLFMATCTHIRGLCDHLKTKIQKFIEDPSDSVALKEFVDYQNSIYEIIKDTQRVFGGVIFIQCMGTLIIVCTEIYVATQVGEILSGVPFSIV